MHIIDGEQRSSISGRTFEVFNPSTGDVMAETAFAEPADVDGAVTSADEAFRSGRWAGMPPHHRAAVLWRLGALIREHAPAIALLEATNSGKPLANAQSEVALGADLVDYFAGLAQLPDGETLPTAPGYFAYARRTPFGVVAAIAPWNYPFLHACWKTVPALAVGNSVVLKMAKNAPLTALRFAELALEAGLPPAVLNVISGDGPTSGAALVEHPLVSKITFTGSTGVGSQILASAATSIKSVHLELGGKSANIVLDDADIDAAVSGSVFTGFYNSGQICTSGSRLLVQESLVPMVSEAVVARVRSLRMGSATDPDTQLGPVISRQHRERVLSFIQKGIDSGAHLATGEPAQTPAGGFYVPPTVFLDVDPQSEIAQEEIFGPVLSVIPFRDEPDAIRIANAVRYGLAATVWTKDLSRAFAFARDLEVGLVWTNCPHYLPFNVPYEGHKVSGLGEDLGVNALRTFTQLKTHLIQFEGPPTQWGDPV